MSIETTDFLFDNSHFSEHADLTEIQHQSTSADTDAALALNGDMSQPPTGSTGTALDIRKSPELEALQLHQDRSKNAEFIVTSSVVISALPEEPEPNWQERGNCLGVDPDLFFPERGSDTRAAKKICNSSEVKKDCLEFALQNGEKFGIWGGLSERERRRVRRQRSQIAKSVIEA